MGINCLWPFLKRFGRKTNFREFSNQTAAIDASCWIHKALYVSISECGTRQRFAGLFQEYLRSVKNAGVTPFVVFDGLPLPAKAKENDRRQRDREKKENRLTRAEGELSTAELNKLRGQAVTVTFEDVTSCIDICLSESLKYVVSPYESDAQIAFLLANGYADFAISEDSDLLAYGCKKVMAKTSVSGDGECFILSDILEDLNLSLKQFQRTCIAAGCDYLSNVKGIGINKAYQMVVSGRELLQLLESKGASKEYQESFAKAEAVLQHQTVFDMGTCTTVSLEKWETDPPSDIQYLCGNLLENAYANNLAVGNVDTKSGNKILDSYPLFTEATSTRENDDVGTTSRQTTISDSVCDDNSHQEMQCDIIHIDRFSSFKWEIPCFPVIKLEFVRILFKVGSKVSDGVIRKSAATNIQRGKFMCSSHCRIKVQDKEYTVMWELAPMRAAQSNEQSVRNDEPVDNDDDDDEDDNEEAPDETITHCIPFKVLGTCYSRARQDALEEAFDYLYEHNRPVFVKLEAEPDNAFDMHAIAVYVMSSSNYEKVGYIA